MLLVLVVVVLGNSATASRLLTARDITLNGAVSGSANFDGNNNISINTVQSNITVLTGTVNLTNGVGSVNLGYPPGYNKDNCVAISIGVQILANIWDFNQNQSSHIFGCRLNDNNVILTVGSFKDVGSNGDKQFKLVLMKTN